MNEVNAVVSTPPGSYFVVETPEEVHDLHAKALAQPSEEQTLIKLTYAEPHFSAGKNFYIKAELVGQISPPDEVGLLLTRKSLRDTKRDAEQAEREMSERGTGFG